MCRADTLAGRGGLTLEVEAEGPTLSACAVTWPQKPCVVRSALCGFQVSPHVGSVCSQGHVGGDDALIL